MPDINEDKFIELTKEAQTAGRKTFVLIEDADGNWRGTTVKYGKAIFMRDATPETVLALLITHSGQ